MSRETALPYRSSSRTAAPTQRRRVPLGELDTNEARIKRESSVVPSQAPTVGKKKSQPNLRDQLRKQEAKAKKEHATVKAKTTRNNDGPTLHKSKCFSKEGTTFTKRPVERKPGADYNPTLINVSKRNTWAGPIVVPEVSRVEEPTGVEETVALEEPTDAEEANQDAQKPTERVKKSTGDDEQGKEDGVEVAMPKRPLSVKERERKKLNACLMIPKRIIKKAKGVAKAGMKIVKGERE